MRRASRCFTPKSSSLAPAISLLIAGFLPPPRYSVRRLDHSHSEEIRLRDLCIGQSSPPATPVAVTTGARLEQGCGGAVQGENTPSSTSDRVGTAQFGSMGRKSSPIEGISNAADNAFPSQSGLKGEVSHRHDRSSVQSAEASDQRDGRGSGTPDGGRRSRPGSKINPRRQRRNRHEVPPTAEEAIRFGMEQGVVPRLSPSPCGSAPNSPILTLPQSSSFVQLSSAGWSGSPFPQQRGSRTSTLSGLGSSSGCGSRPRSQLEAVRAEREAVEAEARQAMARAAPNLFPEIFMAPPAPGDGKGGSETIAGRRGWLAEAESKPSSAAVVNRQ